MADPKHPTLIAGTVPEGTGDTGRSREQAKAEQEAQQKALLATMESWLADKMRELEIRSAEKMRKAFFNIPTRSEVGKSLRGIVRGFQERFTTQQDVKKIMKDLERDIGNHAYVTRNEAKVIATQAVPSTLRGMDSSSSQRTGNTLLLAPGGASGTDSAYWGTLAAGGLIALGDRVVFKGIVLREYDENGVIVAPEDSINPNDYGSVALYAAALSAITHSLKPTWDWDRFI